MTRHLSEPDRRLTVETRLLAVVSLYGGQTIVAGPAMERMTTQLADEADHLASDGLLPAPVPAGPPEPIGDLSQVPLVGRLVDAIDEQLRAGPTVAALVELRRDLGAALTGLPPMPDVEELTPYAAAAAAQRLRHAATSAPADTPVPELGQHVGDGSDPPRPFADLAPSGLLWLINATVFHPRGYAFALVVDRATGEQAAGWKLLGDGTEPWRYDVDCDDRFAAAEATFAAAWRRTP